MKPVYILNVSGGHGHFLQWLLDKFCTATPSIEKIPFNNLGASHIGYKKSGKFIFIDDTETESFLKSNKNKNAIMITIENEILYWERSCMYRAGDQGTDLFDEKSIKKFLTINGSQFPKLCEDKKISIKEGYRLAFQDLDRCGARIHDIKRKNYMGIENNKVYFLKLGAFLNCELLRRSLIAISNHYKFDIDLNDFEKIYHMWYSKNTILQSQKNIEKYTKQQSTKLDILQQAYVDAQKE
jgi:hypothetical protein